MESIGQLLILLQKAHRKAIAERLTALQLYPGQDGLLYHLSRNDGQTMSDLVERMGIRHPTLFTMVNRMETAGLIRKEKDGNDRRASRIFLTAKGRKQLAQLAQIWQEIEKRLTKGMHAEERNATKAALARLIDNLGQE